MEKLLEKLDLIGHPAALNGIEKTCHLTLPTLAKDRSLMHIPLQKNVDVQKPHPKITPASTPNSLSHILTSLTILISNHVQAKNMGKTSVQISELESMTTQDPVEGRQRETNLEIIMKLNPVAGRQRETRVETSLEIMREADPVKGRQRE